MVRCISTTIKEKQSKLERIQSGHPIPSLDSFLSALGSSYILSAVSTAQLLMSKGTIKLQKYVSASAGEDRRPRGEDETVD